MSGKLGQRRWQDHEKAGGAGQANAHSAAECMQTSKKILFDRDFDQ